MDNIIHIEASDFCTVCDKWIGKYYTKCEECSKIPVTFAELCK